MNLVSALGICMPLWNLKRCIKHIEL